MISLTKGAEPEILKQQGGHWLEELLAAIQLGDPSGILSKKRRYNHPDIKKALIQETNGKCAYCEASVVAVAHGDIEHIYPKSLEPRKTFAWDNLTFACQICNQNKSDKDPEATKIIDPYTVDPSRFIRFFAHFINSRGTEEGRFTISYLGLDRAALNERRLEVFRNLTKLVELIQTARSDDERRVLIADFEANELAPQKEFLALRRDFWRSVKSEL